MRFDVNNSDDDVKSWQRLDEDVQIIRASYSAALKWQMMRRHAAAVSFTLMLSWEYIVLRAGPFECPAVTKAVNYE